MHAPATRRGVFLPSWLPPLAVPAIVLYNPTVTELDVSVVIPVRNEKENLAPLREELTAVLGDLAVAWEILFVDDASEDGSAELLDELAVEDSRLRVFHFQCHCGQSAALLFGFTQARGQAIVVMDADRQTDPRDIPVLLKLLPGHGAVVGIRTQRRDTCWRRFSSWFANGVRNWLTRESIQDTGCPMKVFAAAALRELPRFDGAHRFLPTLVRLNGYDVVQVPVRHFPRTAGRSKYGTWDRAWRGLRDALGVRWLQDRHLRWQMRRP